MRKQIIIFLIIVILAGLGFVLYKGNAENKRLAKLNKTTESNFEKTYNYLSKLASYPIPSGDVILLNKKGEEIHLENRKISLSKVKGLYAIQGTTCDILKNNKKFNSFNYDPRFSIIKGNKVGGKVLFKKCFAYSVTKDGKHYQIGTIEKINDLTYKTKILGNLSKSIIRAYDSPVLVKNGDEDFLPYSPEKLSPIVKVENIGDSNILAEIESEDNTYSFKLKEGINKLLSGDLNQKFQIKISGTFDKNTKVSFVDTNGSIVYLKPNKDGKLDFRLKNYQIDTKRINYVLEAGKFLASIVRLSPEKDMEVHHKGTTLVIRGTKFVIDSSEKEFSTYLLLGHIVQELAGGNKSLDLTRLASASVIIGNHLVKNMERIKQLISYAVFNDIKTLPKYNYNINGSNVLTGIVQPNLLSINFSNGENIILGLIDREKFSKYLEKNKQINFNSINPLLAQCNKSNINVENLENEIKKCDSKKDKVCYSLKKKIGLCSGDNKESCIKSIYTKVCSIVSEENLYKNFVNNICKNNFKASVGLDISKLHYILSNDSNDILNGFKIKSDIASKIGANKYVLLTSRNGGINGSVNNSTRIGLKSNGSIVDIPLPNLSSDSNIDKIIVACER